MVQRPIAHEFSRGDYSENARHRPCHTGYIYCDSHAKTAWRLCQPESGFNPLEARFFAPLPSITHVHFSRGIFRFRPIQAPNRQFIQARELDKRPRSLSLEKPNASPLGLESMTNGVQSVRWSPTSPAQPALFSARHRQSNDLRTRRVLPAQRCSKRRPPTNRP